jgi:hypothetical protein
MSMSISKELGRSTLRFKGQVERLIHLLQENEVRSLRALVRVIREDERFAQEWRAAWREIAQKDGGKISLTTAGTVLAAALGGGVGISAMGTAIGIPLAAVLGIGGFVGLVVGAEVDASRTLARNKRVFIKVPKPLYERISSAAKLSAISSNELIVRTLGSEFTEFDESTSC